MEKSLPPSRSFISRGGAQHYKTPCFHLLCISFFILLCLYCINTSMLLLFTQAHLLLVCPLKVSVNPFCSSRHF